jgi:hypothetical protein
MKPIIRFGLGAFEIDWQDTVINYGKLFLDEEHKIVEFADFNDYDDSIFIVKKEKAYIASLKKILPRLELLGYGFNQTKRKYNNLIDELPLYEDETDKYSFDEFCSFLMQIDCGFIKPNVDLLLALTEGFELDEILKLSFGSFHTDHIS